MRRAVLIAFGLSLVLASQGLAQDPSYTPFGQGCGAGSFEQPSLDGAAGSLPTIDDRFTVLLKDLPFKTAAEPGAVVILLGFSSSQWLGIPLPLDLNNLGAPGCIWYVSGQQVFAQNYSGETARWIVDIPNTPSLIGSHIFNQGVILDPGANPLGLVTTNAAEGVIGLNRGPEATIIFPPPKSLTNENSILVRGTASDKDGIDEVRINGQLATTSDGFANWQLRLPISVGRTSINVQTLDGLGFVNNNAAQANIESQARFTKPQDITFDSGFNRAIVETTQGIASVDLATGNRTALSDRRTGSGIRLNALKGISLDGNRLLIVGVKTLIELDLAAGVRQFISNSAVPPSPSAAAARGLALLGREALVLVQNTNQQTGQPFGSVVGVDLTSGIARVISSETTVGGGTALREPMCITIDGDRALITDVGSVITVDLLTGHRDILSSGFRGAGPSLATPQGITMNGDHAILVETGFRAIYGLDLVTGDRSLISNNIRGDGPDLISPWGITMANGAALVTDTELEAIFSIEPISGDRTLITRSGTGDGDCLRRPAAMVLDKTRLLVLDSGSQSLVQIDRETGDRRVISDSDHGTGPMMIAPIALAMDGNRVFILDEILDALLEVNLSTGNRQVVSNSVIGNGPQLRQPAAMVLAGNQALVVDTTLRALLSVDLATGDREVISGPARGTGTQLPLVNSMIVEGNRVLLTPVPVLHPFVGSIIAVDLSTGNRTVLSDDQTGSGPILGFASALTLDDDRVLVSNVVSIMAVDLQTGDRSVVATPRPETNLYPSTGMELDGDQAILIGGPSRKVTQVDLLTGEQTILSK